VDVLIADDDELTRAVLRTLLERQGYACAEAPDGTRALELARRLSPRCVLLDLVMPGLDGLAVARGLRADPATRATRVHCLSGYADAEHRRAALGAGCELFLAKPVSPQALLDAVRGPGAPAGEGGSRRLLGPLCPRCGCGDVSPTPFRWYEWPLVLLLLRPCLCRRCSERLVGFLWQAR
jgi:two-component system cell cycle response regulator DivK